MAACALRHLQTVRVFQVSCQLWPSSKNMWLEQPRLQGGRESAPQGFICAN